MLGKYSGEWDSGDTEVDREHCRAVLDKTGHCTHELAAAVITTKTCTTPDQLPLHHAWVCGAPPITDGL